MPESDSAALKPLADVDGVAAFNEPWQAEALALADSLVNQGMFSATVWSDTLGQALKESKHRNEKDSQENYYLCVLRALEKLVTSYSEIDRQSMDARRKDWEKAYLSTPHGQPVYLK